MSSETSPSSGQYLSPRALRGLAAYQYKSGGYSLLDRLHNPVWDGLVGLMPMWLAPNLITLMGTLCVVAAYLVTMLHQPLFTGDSPRWVYVWSGVAVVLYVNLDCMDGKQARRTRSSSPLGQLFDHGCDALSLPLLMATVRCALNMGWGWGAVVMEMAVMIPWLLAHWEEYHTGIMLYGNGWFGVLEGNYALVVINFISAAYGPSIWSTPLPFTMPSALAGLQCVRDVFFVVVAVMAGISCLGQLQRVAQFPTSSLSKQEQGHKQLGYGAAAMHLAYLALLTGLGSTWMASPVHDLMDNVRTLHANVGGGLGGLGGGAWATWLQAGVIRLPQATFGFVYATVALQLIVAHMAKEPFVPFSWALAVLALGSGNAVLRLVDPLPLNWLLLATTLVAFTHYATSVIDQICKYLGIKCLTISPKVQ
ncbi:CDP-Ethanolamine:DAG ethanolamine phosphotransferase [Haematococcus lacustris]